MGGDALAAVKDLDRTRCDARPNLLAQQLVRNRVVVLVYLDVVVEPDPALLPFGEDIGLGRQRLERCALQLLELAPRWRDTRLLICATSSAIAAFSCVS